MTPAETDLVRAELAAFTIRTESAETRVTAAEQRIAATLEVLR